MTVAAIVLAAGAGSRFEGPQHKLLAELQGRPVVAHSVQAAVDAGFNQVYVVVGAADLEAALPAGVTVVRAEDWAEGQSHTLQAGIAAALADGHRAVVVGLGDQPMVPSSAWRSVGASRGEIVTAVFDGKRRPPVKLEQSIWDLLPTSGDDGARTLMQSRPDLVSEVPCSGNPSDIDTHEDLSRWN